MTDAKTYLRQVKLLDIHISNKLEELQRLRGLSYKISSSLNPNFVSGSRNMDKIGDSIAKIVDLEVEINREIDLYVNKKREITDIIEKVTDPDQLEVLYRRYIQFETFETIASEMNMTYRNACYIHGKALQTVEQLLSR